MIRTTLLLRYTSCKC